MARSGNSAAETGTQRTTDNANAAKYRINLPDQSVIVIEITHHNTREKATAQNNKAYAFLAGVAIKTGESAS
jgi:hypothetical protein